MKGLLAKENRLFEFRAIGGQVKLILHSCVLAWMLSCFPILIIFVIQWKQVELSIRANDMFIGTVLKSLEIEDLVCCKGNFVTSHSPIKPERAEEKRKRASWAAPLISKRRRQSTASWRNFNFEPYNRKAARFNSLLRLVLSFQITAGYLVSLCLGFPSPWIFRCLRGSWIESKFRRKRFASEFDFPRGPFRSFKLNTAVK